MIEHNEKWNKGAHKYMRWKVIDRLPREGRLKVKLSSGTSYNIYSLNMQVNLVQMLYKYLVYGGIHNRSVYGPFPLQSLVKCYYWRRGLKIFSEALRNDVKKLCILLEVQSVRGVFRILSNICHGTFCKNS